MHFWQLSAAQHITHCWDHTQLTSDKHSEVIRISRVNISELEAAAGDQEIADLVRGDYTQPGGDRGTLNCAAQHRPKVLTPVPGTPPLLIQLHQLILILGPCLAEIVDFSYAYFTSLSN